MDSIMLEQAGNGGPPDDEGNLIVQVVSDIVSSVFDGGVNRSVSLLTCRARPHHKAGTPPIPSR
jgi:hypothetical protein